MTRLTLQEVTARFEARHARSLARRKELSAMIPGGYSRHPLTFGPHAIYVTGGQDAELYTLDGHSLVDFHNNFSATICGHNHPAIREALSAALAHGFSFANPMPQEAELARRLTARLPAAERVVFTASASEAAIAAVRIARANTGRNRIAKFEGGYHGVADDFMLSLHPFPELMPGPPDHPNAVPNSAGVPKHVRENVVVLPQNDLEACTRILRAEAHDVACVVLELQAGAGGVIVAERDFVSGLRELTRELGVLLIIDETITFRAGYRGMQGIYDVTPDLMILGKTIGGGMPVGAVAGRADLFALGEAGEVYHSGTHHGHPLAMAAGIACLDVLDEAAFARLNGMGQRIKQALNDWCLAEGYPFVIYGLGSHLGYEFCDRPGRQYRSCRDILCWSDEERMQAFALEMTNRGYFPMYRGQIALSLAMTGRQIDGFIGTAQAVIEELCG
ncbi:MAG: aminotransferase class III-fold pyridoxal phosphate-dependent enzyme [Gammaproteobacteria bacterium]|nr:aminotransferase class III-fold pyridoxal phosphate-dependent enzyme [Gammaproteobacteria bacterium]